jgi:hypothetical protein
VTARWVPVACAAISILVAGCFIPFGNFNDDNFPMPTLLATYTHGAASMEIKQGDTTQTIQLNRVAAGSTLVSITGASVTWRNDDGWGLQVSTVDTSTVFGQGPSPSAGKSPGATAAPYVGDFAVMLIADHEYWRASNYSITGSNRCIVDLTEASAIRVAGSATCRGLRWTDGTITPMMLDPVYIDGQESFDAEITFEATP